MLAEPSRRQLLAALLRGPQSVSSLVSQGTHSQPVVSKHLRILKDADFVTVQPDGQRRLYQLNPTAFATIDSWLTPYRKLWSGRLDRLEDFLDTGPGDDL